jgi:pSer/pThr/pTyr-binding forkhead associated (FHA) protein
MSELTLFVLRFGFLAILWIFVFAVVFALRSDLFGHYTRRSDRATPDITVNPAAKGATFLPPSDAPVNADPARTLTITAGAREGLEIPLDADQLTIGRSAQSGLVIRDEYTSTHHARLQLWNGDWVIQDLTSTNGTFVNNQRVSVPTPVPLYTPVSIGSTIFELRP